MLDTKIFTQESELNEAAKIIKNGGLVVMPTETVYGLAADALNASAIKKIFKVKGRPADNPLIVHISHIDELAPLVSKIPTEAKILADKFWPGPLTMILPKSEKVPYEVTAGLDTVAIRMPSLHITKKFIEKCETPLAAPSANLSGKPSPTSCAHVIADLKGKVKAIIDGGNCEYGVESTVITLATTTPKLLRPGGITLEQLQQAIGHVDVDEAVLNKLGANAIASSPGMKYKHYAPNTKVIMINGSSKNFIQYVNKQSSENILALCFDEEVKDITTQTISYGSVHDQKQQAAKLFDALRETDSMQVKCVYAHAPTPSGIGLATYNRLIRAAGFEVVDL